jgi:hypothetical protein
LANIAGLRNQRFSAKSSRLRAIHNIIGHNIIYQDFKTTRAKSQEPRAQDRFQSQERNTADQELQEPHKIKSHFIISRLLLLFSRANILKSHVAKTGYSLPRTRAKGSQNQRLALRAKSQEPRAKPRAKSQEPRAHGQELRVKSQEPRAKSQD